MEKMTDFDKLLQIAAEFHGETCPGIIFGTRMAIAGLSALGMSPFEKNAQLMVYDEIDRCATDAIQAICNVSLGRRTLKHRQLGKFAATFVDTHTQKAFRISFKPRWPDKPLDLLEFGKFVRNASDDELFTIEEVIVEIKPEERPGFPSRKVTCSQCGEEVMDGEELVIDGTPTCKNCASDSYYEPLK
jgi:formylmethanofuran dehydrogenase subunit E